MRVNWDAQDALGRELAERKSPRNRDSSPMRPSARMSATGGPSWTAGGALRDVMVEKEIEAVADPAPAPAPVVVPPLGPRPKSPKSSSFGSLKNSSGPPPRSSRRDRTGTSTPRETKAEEPSVLDRVENKVEEVVEIVALDVGFSKEPEPAPEPEPVPDPVVSQPQATEQHAEPKPKAPPVNPLKNVKVKLNMPDGSFSTVLIGPHCTVAEVCGTVAFRRGYNPLVLYTIYSVQEPGSGTKTVTELKPVCPELLRVPGTQV